jgi:hypothetical protein
MVSDHVAVVCRLFELDEDKRITMQEIKQHPSFTTPLTEKFQAAMNDILSEQMKLDYIVRRHGVCFHVLVLHRFVHDETQALHQVFFCR